MACLPSGAGKGHEDTVRACTAMLATWESGQYTAATIVYMVYRHCYYLFEGTKLNGDREKHECSLKCQNKNGLGCKNE